MQSIILVSLVLLALISSFANGQSIFTVSSATMTYVFNEGPGESDMVELTGNDDDSGTAMVGRFYVQDTEDEHITIEGHCGEPFCKYMGMVNTDGSDDKDGHYLDCCLFRHSPVVPLIPENTILRMYDADHSERIDFQVTTKGTRCGDNSFDNEGFCEYCGCDPLGADTLSCDESGDCTCNPGYVGDKCDRCATGSFRTSTDEECSECSCVVANLDETVCNAETGECQCSSSFTGSTCCFKKVDVDGAEIDRQSSVVSAYHCHDACVDNTDCNHFTYYNEDHATDASTCILRSEEGEEVGGTLNDVTNISGPKVCNLG